MPGIKNLHVARNDASVVQSHRRGAFGLVEKSSIFRPNTGIFASEDEALQGLVRCLADALDPQAIWLFGSRARGDHRPESDFDLMVVAKPGANWGSDDYEAVYKPAKGTLVGCDIVPCAKSDFDEAATLHTSFVAIVVDEGQKLYEARA